MTNSPNTMPVVPVSWGELFDKITILEIKVERLTTESARANAAKERDLLRNIAQPAAQDAKTTALAAKLKALNEQLWDIEDDIRGHEKSGTFDAAFIALARSIYKINDARAAVKRELNLALGSQLMEEKSYRPY